VRNYGLLLLRDRSFEENKEASVTSFFLEQKTKEENEKVSLALKTKKMVRSKVIKKLLGKN
jgi:hypothetical protein